GLRRRASGNLLESTRQRQATHLNLAEWLVAVVSRTRLTSRGPNAWCFCGELASLLAEESWGGADRGPGALMLRSEREVRDDNGISEPQDRTCGRRPGLGYRAGDRSA